MAAAGCEGSTSCVDGRKGSEDDWQEWLRGEVCLRVVDWTGKHLHLISSLSGIGWCRFGALWVVGGGWWVVGDVRLEAGGWRLDD